MLEKQNNNNNNNNKNLWLYLEVIPVRETEGKAMRGYILARWPLLNHRTQSSPFLQGTPSSMQGKSRWIVHRNHAWETSCKRRKEKRLIRLPCSLPYLHRSILAPLELTFLPLQDGTFDLDLLGSFSRSHTLLLDSPPRDGVFPLNIDVVGQPDPECVQRFPPQTAPQGGVDSFR